MKKILFIAICVSLISCSANVQNYKDRKPEFAFETFFDGNLCAWGLLKGRTGEVKRKFVADIVASQQDGFVILDEVFRFDDGEEQLRKWRFKRDKQEWIGTAGDVVGQAIGEVIGDSMHLTYELAILNDGDTINVAMDDWLHLVDDNTLMGTTDMSKWGFNVGQIQITIKKQQELCLQSSRDA